MQRYREHGKCKSRPSSGCLAYGVDSYTHPKRLRRRYTRWLRTHFTVELWWVLLSLIPVLFGTFWVAGR